MEKNILILGATSAIARATSITLMENGDNVFLASRDIAELERIAKDLEIRFKKEVKYAYFAAEKIQIHAKFFSEVINEIGSLDGVILSFGFLTDANIDCDNAIMTKIIDVNFTGAVSILNCCANYFSLNKKGFIVGISSVAGDRGRQVNQLYGAAKGALSLYLQGLRSRLLKDNVHVMTVKPGFVDTPMTFGRKGLFLVADPQTIGKKIVLGLQKKRNIVYLPWFWYYIMLVIKLIPESIYKRLRF